MAPPPQVRLFSAIVGHSFCSLITMLSNIEHIVKPHILALTEHCLQTGAKLLYTVANLLQAVENIQAEDII